MHVDDDDDDDETIINYADIKPLPSSTSKCIHHSRYLNLKHSLVLSSQNPPIKFMKFLVKFNSALPLE